MPSYRELLYKLASDVTQTDSVALAIPKVKVPYGAKDTDISSVISRPVKEFAAPRKQRVVDAQDDARSWHGGKIIYGKDGFTFISAKGFPYTYKPNMVGQWSNIDNYLGKKPDRKAFRALPWNEFMSIRNGLPNKDYQQQWNKYHGNVPDAVWNKTYYPATKEQRLGFSGFSPNIEYDVDETNAWFDPDKGTISIGWIPGLIQSDRVTAFTPGYYNSGSRVGDTLIRARGALGSDDAVESDTRAHELTHANMFSLGWDSYGMGHNSDFVDDEDREAAQKAREAYMPDATAQQLDRSHPRLLPNVYGYVENHDLHKNNGWTKYMGNPGEEAQASHAFKDGIAAQQRYMKQHPELFSQFPKEDIQKFLAINPWFKSPQEMWQAYNTLRSIPHVAMTMSPEALRWMDYARGHEMEPADYEGRKAFENLYFANNGNNRLNTSNIG